MKAKLKLEKIFKELQSEREFIILDEEETERYLAIFQICIREYGDTIDNKPYLYRYLEDLMCLLRGVGLLSKYPFSYLKVDKISGFPSWSGIEEIYLLKNKAHDTHKMNEKNIIDNARYRLLRGENVDVNAQNLQLQEFYYQLENLTLPCLGDIRVEGKNTYQDLKYTIKRSRFFSMIEENYQGSQTYTMGCLYYNPVKNQPDLWFFEIDVDRLLERTTHKNSYITDEFKNLIKEYLFFGPEGMCLMVEKNSPGVVRKINKISFGPFYFSPYQEIDVLENGLKNASRYIEQGNAFLFIQEKEINLETGKNDEYVVH
ncbi:MAG: hypothetical protein DRP03_02270 [Candidatus Aenigmatarchaeota archaeon]|nr:MAG: hypothetical protein DRP03_02270 [Candidatus Aenigmarchaeota archaeon]